MYEVMGDGADISVLFDFGGGGGGGGSSSRC